VTGKHNSMKAPERGASNKIVADTSHFEMRVRAQFGFDRIDQWTFGATRRRNVDKRGRAGQEIGAIVRGHDQVAAP
jgi:hypothetical protein